MQALRVMHELPEIDAKICVFSQFFRPRYSRASSPSDSRRLLVIDAKVYEVVVEGWIDRKGLLTSS